MAVMKAVQVSKPGGQFELVERPIPEPGRGQVRIKVEACGICHSDVVVKDGLWPGLQYPRVPGHEIAGRVDAVGTDVANWKAGQRVGRRHQHAIPFARSVRDFKARGELSPYRFARESRSFDAALPHVDSPDYARARPCARVRCSNLAYLRGSGR